MFVGVCNVMQCTVGNMHIYIYLFTYSIYVCLGKLLGDLIDGRQNLVMCETGYCPLWWREILSKSRWWNMELHLGMEVGFKILLYRTHVAFASNMLKLNHGGFQIFQGCKLLQFGLVKWNACRIIACLFVVYSMRCGCDLPVDMRNWDGWLVRACLHSVTHFGWRNLLSFGSCCK